MKEGLTSVKIISAPRSISVGSSRVGGAERSVTTATRPFGSPSRRSGYEMVSTISKPQVTTSRSEFLGNLGEFRPDTAQRQASTLAPQQLASAGVGEMPRPVSSKSEIGATPVPQLENKLPFKQLKRFPETRPYSIDPQHVLNPDTQGSMTTSQMRELSPFDPTQHNRVSHIVPDTIANNVQIVDFQKRELPQVDKVPQLYYPAMPEISYAPLVDLPQVQPIRHVEPIILTPQIELQKHAIRTELSRIIEKQTMPAQKELTVVRTDPVEPVPNQTITNQTRTETLPQLHIDTKRGTRLMSKEKPRTSGQEFGDLLTEINFKRQAMAAPIVDAPQEYVARETKRVRTTTRRMAGIQELRPDKIYPDVHEDDEGLMVLIVQKVKLLRDWEEHLPDEIQHLKKKLTTIFTIGDKRILSPDIDWDQLLDKKKKTKRQQQLATIPSIKVQPEVTAQLENQTKPEAVLIQQLSTVPETQLVQKTAVQQRIQSDMAAVQIQTPATETEKNMWIKKRLTQQGWFIGIMTWVKETYHPENRPKLHYKVEEPVQKRRFSEWAQAVRSAFPRFDFETVLPLKVIAAGLSKKDKSTDSTLILQFGKSTDGSNIDWRHTLMGNDMLVNQPDAYYAGLSVIESMPAVVAKGEDSGKEVTSIDVQRVLSGDAEEKETELIAA
ncbi:MAG TPA: hypothetical protein VLF93_05790 [Candidatus Saccharimonadales bacterium]|nr:hypothetical protein [Candidatus Saccharimonadales bacterium]